MALRVRVVCVAIMQLFLVPAAALAQAGSGLAGVVTDATGGVLPGVTVEASSPALIEKIRSVVTDSQGEYKIINLRPGTYSLTFTLVGFGTVKREGIELTSNFTATVNAELRPGTLEETVNVTGASPLVDVQNVLQQRVLQRQVLESLPTGRGINAYAEATPGIAVATTFQDVGGNQNENWVALALHGSRSVDSRILMGGMRINRNGADRGIMVNAAIVEDISLEMSGMSAEDDNGGVRINIIPKDGGNQFSAFAIGSFTNNSLQSSNLNDDLRARGLTSVNSVDHIWDANAAVGGPILRDRLWFYTAHRDWGRVARIGGNYNNATQGTPIYTPDLSNVPLRDEHERDHSARFTWQAARKHKLNLHMTYEDVCICQTGLGTSAAGPGQNYAPEATTTLHFFPDNLVQFTWTAPLTNKLLLEAGASNLIHHEPRYAQPGVKATDIAITELSTGYTYNANVPPLCCQYGDIHNDQTSGRFAVSYVTGSHAYKAGVSWLESRNLTISQVNGSLSYSFLNGVPVSLTEWVSPLNSVTRTPQDMGVFAQDQWTLRRLTLNLGLRFDYYNSYVPAQHLAATQFLPAYSFAPVYDAPNWKDLNPRVGAAYNLFGDGRTALKASIGRYVVAQSGIVGNNPVNTIVNNATRTWTDADRDYIPDCDLTNPAANGECGAVNNRTFGQPVVTTNYATTVTGGWGTRPYNWVATIEVQHELRPGVSVSGGYFRRWYGNFTVTNNLAVTPADYSPYSISAPIDPKLPGGGGFLITGLYDVSPGKFNQVNNLVQPAADFGDMTEVHNFFSGSISARFRNGAFLSGGLDTGRTSGVYPTSTFAAGANHCFVVNSPQELRFCDIVIPFAAQTQIKLIGSYPLLWNLLASGTWQSLPGIPITASYVATNAQIAPSLGRNLAAGANGTALIELIKPGTQYDGRINQLDLRLSKSFSIGARGVRRVLANIDVYNALNASPDLAINTRYGPTWLKPIQILDGRLFKIGAQLNF
jgi:hypothetical protein